jgi:isoleucyl-tRNA synthetase
MELDRWLMSRLNGLVADLTAAYETFEFHRVYHAVNAFCAVELSSFYVDVTKDLMYTFAPASAERRSAQTAMHAAVATLAKLIAPVMPFTAEEVWSFLPGRECESVHLAAFPAAGARDADLEARWEQLLEIRRVVAGELEKARQAGVIGKSLEAQVEIRPGTAATETLLRQFAPVLETVLIVSQARVGQLTGVDLQVMVAPAAGQKCARCWRHTTDVGANQTHPLLCGRCVDAVTQKIQTS